jgi:predicted SAM-dependent methyltransferase
MFNDNIFDYVYSSHLLEDFENTEEVLIEWVRILKKDGYLILNLPDQKRYIECCNKNNAKTNPNHKIDMNFSYLDSIAKKLNLELIKHIPVHGEYSFLTVYKKINITYSQSVDIRTLIDKMYEVDGEIVIMLTRLVQEINSLMNLRRPTQTK